MSKQRLKDNELYQVALYLSNPKVETDIHAEMLDRNRREFEEQYKVATKDSPLPPVGREPYYIWPPGTNKYGKELRIYFKDTHPKPTIIERLCTDYGKWYAKSQSYRINHSALVMQLFECGFLLGKNAGNAERIRNFMNRRFPPDAAKNENAE